MGARCFAKNKNKSRETRGDHDVVLCVHRLCRQTVCVLLQSIKAHDLLHIWARPAIRMGRVCRAQTPGVTAAVLLAPNRAAQ